MAKYLGQTGLMYLWGKIKTWVGNYVKIVSGTGKDTITAGNNSVDIYDWAQASTKPSYTQDEITEGTTNKPFTATEKTKLSGIAAGAEVNVQADWNQTSLTADDYIKNKPNIMTHSGGNNVSDIIFGTESKISSDNSNNITIESIDDDVNISAGGKAFYNNKEIAVKDDLPTKTSDLTNDSGFITTSDIPEGAAASTTTPKMDGTAAVGTETAFARGDHRHPSDTTKADKSATVSTVAYDTTNKKITKTINGTTTDVVTAAKIVTDGGGVTDVSGKVDKTTTVNGHALSGNVTVSKSDVGLGNVTNDAQIPLTQKGVANGVCPLDANTKIDAQYLPSYVDDVVEAYIRSGQTALSQSWLATGSATGTVITPQSGVIYVLMNGTDDYPTNSQYRWATNTYVKLNDGGVSELTTAEMDTATNNWA